MKKALHWIVKCLLYSNIFIAICAMSFLANAYLLLGKEIKYDALLWLIGFSTFFTYMLIRLVAVKRISNYEPEERWNFYLRHLNFIKIATAISLVICVGLYFLLDKDLKTALIIPAIISVLYGIPFGKDIRLRDIGLIKIFLIAFVWAYISSVLPGIASGYKVLSTEILLLFFANYCFVFAIAIHFDLKDIQIDATNNVKTLPVLLGENNTYSLSMLLLFISAGLHILLQRHFLANIVDHTYPVLVSIFATAVMIWISKSNKKNNYLYFGILDGMLLLQFMLCFCFQLFG